MTEYEKHSGRIAQTGIYLGKLLRMFAYQSEWKVMPMAGIMTAVVAFVIKNNMCVNMEGTVKGAFAFSCICIWNGMFNSIQVVCRERAIVKREHRSGLHMSSYVAAHMIYQAFLCAGQCGIVIGVLNIMKVKMPVSSYVTPIPMADFFLTLFLVSYSADIMALFISSLVKNPTTAMTVVPFLLIFQLVFAGTFFALKGIAKKASDFTLSKWGVCAICSQADYNAQPMVSVWKNLKKMRNVEYDGQKPIQLVVDEIIAEGKEEEFQLKCGAENQDPDYESTTDKMVQCWGRLIIYTLIFAAASVISLELIDKDKR